MIHFTDPACSIRWQLNPSSRVGQSHLISPPSLCSKYCIISLSISALSSREILTLLPRSPVLNIMNPYQYPPLSGPRCTQLIRLYPGTTKDPSCPLSCDLDEIDLDDPPKYLALSYTWNGETPSEPLTIGNAQVGSSPAAGSQLLITPNCAAALRACRRSLHRRINRRKCVKIWVDAICINQGSNDDKSSQVAMMAEIYNQAKRVVVWLGERDSPSTSSTIICSSACALLPDVDMGRLGDVFDWIERWKAFKWLEIFVERLEELIANAVLQNCESNIHKPVVMSHKYPLTFHVVCAHNWRNDRL